MTSAIYGLLFSLIICVAAVAIFTGHFLLLLIVLLTIVGKSVVCGQAIRALDMRSRVLVAVSLKFKAPFPVQIT